jgi:hypothetical protein
MCPDVTFIDIETEGHFILILGYYELLLKM